MRTAAKLLKDNGSAFGSKLGGRIDSYGSVLGGHFEFWWTGEKTPADGNYPKAWCQEINGRGQALMLPQDMRMGAYVRCVRK